MYSLSIPQNTGQSFIFPQNVFALHSTQHKGELQFLTEFLRFPFHTEQARVSYSHRMSTHSTLHSSIGQCFIFLQNVFHFHSTQHRAEFHIPKERLRFPFLTAQDRVSYSHSVSSLSILQNSEDRVSYSNRMSPLPFHTAQDRVSYSHRMSPLSFPYSIGQRFIFPQKDFAFHSTQHGAEFHIPTEYLRLSFHSIGQSFTLLSNVFAFSSTQQRAEFHVSTEYLRFPFHPA